MNSAYETSAVAEASAGTAQESATTSTVQESAKTSTAPEVPITGTAPDSARSCLIVLANPKGDRFIAELADIATATFSGSGWNADVIDLTDYAPAMTIEDRRAYHTDNPIVDPVVQSHADKVLAAEALVFVYPVVWGTLPSLLKGWFDRTMVVGVALKLVNGKVKRNLTKVRKVVALAYDSSESHLPGEFHDGGKRLMKRTLTIITHPRCKSVYLRHKTAGKSPGDATAFLTKAKESLRKLAAT